MKKQIGSLVLLLSLVLGSTNAFAIGDAGCGLGSVVFTKNSIVSQVLAATTNATFYSQTFGITTGTSNCHANGLVLNEKEQIYYTEANFDQLKVEMAKGNGEILAAYSEIMGCKDTAHFSQIAQKNFDAISRAKTPMDFLGNVKTTISKDDSLKSNCAI